MTTEQFVLQSAKAAVVSESNGRAALFISAVSSAIVALAFVGQVSGTGETFLWFGLVLFPSLVFLGVATFVRLCQTAIESTVHARGISRIRHYYLEQAPEMARYFVHPPYDDLASVVEDMAIFAPPRPGFLWGAWQRFVAISGVVGAINSVLAGAFTGLLTRGGLGLALPVSVALGITTFVLSMIMHMRYQRFMSDEQLRRLEPLFPRPAPAAPARGAGPV
ncbi:MAG: hypothetical protein ABIY55_13295, partial [Kofleriaceae bacterium]